MKEILVDAIKVLNKSKGKMSNGISNIILLEHAMTG